MQIVKTLKNFIDTKIASYIFTRYPKFVRLVHAYLDFLDNVDKPNQKTIKISKDGEVLYDKYGNLIYDETWQSAAHDILNLTQNLDVKYMPEKFLTPYYNNYCYNIISEKQYLLNNVVKQQMLRMAKQWYNNKGKIFSIYLATRYLNKFFIKNDNIYITSEETDYDINESSYLWLSDNTRPYLSPYSYYIKGVIPIEYIQQLLEISNPVGFYPIFNYETKFYENFDTYRFYEERIFDVNYELGNVATETFILNSSEYVEDLLLLGLSVSTTTKEIYNIYPQLFKYDNNYVDRVNFIHDGGESVDQLLKFDSKGKGIFEDIEITVYENDVVQDTFEWDTASHFDEYYT